MASACNSESYPSLAIVVPVFNEASTIAQACRPLLEVAERYPADAAVLGVDDGSNDASAAILTGLAAASDLLECVRHEANRGYGAAARTGASWALANGFDYVAFIDSDLTNPPEDLLKIGELARRGAPYIKGSRFVAGGGTEEVPFRRSIFSRGGYMIGSLLFGLRGVDVTNGFRAARTDLYCRWPLKEDGFAVIMEEVYWTVIDRIPIANFPTVLHSRNEKQRASSFAYTPRLMGEYLRYPLRVFVRRHRLASRQHEPQQH